MLEESVHLLARIDNERVAMAQRKAAGTVSEDQYAKAMQSLDQTAREITDFTRRNHGP
jgi:hypothetical protein